MIATDWPTPITSVSGFGLDKYAITLDIKRDDLIHPFISGNKWRKLKYLLEDAQKQQKNTLVTFGGAWSNHLLATACAGAVFGFSTVGFVRGDEGVSNPLLAMCRLYGMELRYVDRERYRDKRLLFDELVAELGHKNVAMSHQAGTPSLQLPYFIDEGGYATEALDGCAEIIAELPAEYDHLFCACGTGTTLAGLALGMDRFAGPSQGKLHGVPVLAGGAFIADNVRSLYTEANCELHLDYHFGGYAKTSPELVDFVREFCAGTGILIEPVYTGKLFYAVFDLIRSGYFEPGSRILVLHSGGMTGLLGKYELF